MKRLLRESPSSRRLPTRASRRWLLCAVAGASMTSCGGSDHECGEEAGPASIEVGVLVGGVFAPFVESSTIDVVHGFQGGMWVMPAVQVTNIDPGGHMSGAMSLATDGSLLGEGGHDVRLEQIAASTFLLRYIPVPVGAVAGSPPLAELDEAAARLRVSFVDRCGVSATYERVLRMRVEEGAL